MGLPAPEEGLHVEAVEVEHFAAEGPRRRIVAELQLALGRVVPAGNFELPGLLLLSGAEVRVRLHELGARGVLLRCAHKVALLEEGVAFRFPGGAGLDLLGMVHLVDLPGLHKAHELQVVDYSGFRGHARPAEVPPVRPESHRRGHRQPAPLTLLHAHHRFLQAFDDLGLAGDELQLVARRPLLEDGPAFGEPRSVPHAYRGPLVGPLPALGLEEDFLDEPALQVFNLVDLDQLESRLEDGVRRDAELCGCLGAEAVLGLDREVALPPPLHALQAQVERGELAAPLERLEARVPAPGLGLGLVPPPGGEGRHHHLRAAAHPQAVPEEDLVLLPRGAPPLSRGQHLADQAPVAADVRGARPAEQLHLEREGRAPRDLRGRALRPVGVLGGARQDALLPLEHGGDSLVPALDDAPLAHLEAELLAPVDAGVEDGSVLEAARVVHEDLVPRLGVLEALPRRNLSAQRAAAACNVVASTSSKGWILLLEASSAKSTEAQLEPPQSSSRTSNATLARL